MRVHLHVSLHHISGLRDQGGQNTSPNTAAEGSQRRVRRLPYLYTHVNANTVSTPELRFAVSQMHSQSNISKSADQEAESAWPGCRT
ncbi:Uncharacterized protein DAT39_004339 [Clarias magur]|uniref:Uncharacterized protein n=1 Tax=Clarias magur TaxID=1594786 RepID=A0A8J4TXQ4_CLAMG|nr:Uncharacterized protein DAT39_004339 [Clarias magur]